MKKADPGPVSRFFISTILSLTLLVLPVLSFSSSAPERSTPHQRLMGKSISDGRVPVIVTLRHAGPPASHSDRAGLALHRQSLRRVQDRVVKRIKGDRPAPEKVQGFKRFRYTPGFAFHAAPDELEALFQDPDVVDIVEDKAVPPSLRESVPLVGADRNGHYDGYSGLGQVVAVLDTGVDASHPFLRDKVVSDACYSTTSDFCFSLCPRKTESSTAPGSGSNCNPAIDRGCDHGTHVAGIAAGKGPGFTGVAPDAGIIAIQVFSLFYGSYCSETWDPFFCVLSWSSDQIRGLERVYELRNEFDIASVNMSLGSGQYFEPCDTDPLKPIVDALKAAGIATVISSGNDSFTGSLGSPACISSAVSVGSSTKQDTVSGFSNSADFLDLLAPGSDIYSSISGGGFEAWNGTSMAAPHVAGAWAVLKQARPDAGVDELLNMLTVTGKPVYDDRPGAGERVTPRIQIDQALALPPDILLDHVE